MHTILHIEENKSIRDELRRALQNEDFLVLEAMTGKRSLEILKEYKTDTILSEITLPDMCGLKLIKEIREITNAPLVVLSQENSEDKKVMAFDLGADDFVSKPCSIKLLLARIKSHLRRAYQDLEQTTNAHDNEHHLSNTKFSDWILDHSRFQVFNKNKISAELTSKEFHLLEYLITNAGRAIPRIEICEAIREENYIPTTRALDIKVTRIRKKIGDDAHDPKIIQTIRGIGYLFNKDIISSN